MFVRSSPFERALLTEYFLLWRLSTRIDLIDYVYAVTMVFPLAKCLQV